MLVQQPDPRHPHLSSELIVDELDQDAPGWFRAKVPRYGIRIVFRLIIVQQGIMVELRRLEPIPDDADEYYVDIVQAGDRRVLPGAGPPRRAVDDSSHEDAGRIITEWPGRTVAGTASQQYEKGKQSPMPARHGASSIEVGTEDRAGRSRQGQASGV